MGSGSFSSHAWNTYSSSKGYATASAEQIYSQRQIAEELNPRNVTIRESRDSADNPRSTPLIVGLDVTGSMQMVLASMAKEGLNTLMTEVYARKPITDPHVMAMGIGDAECDDAPLQVTQFEADIRIAQQLERIWLEKGGGGNQHESYTLPWYFAAHHTAIDSFEKRGEKGWLFTVGDEEPNMTLYKENVKEVFGHAAQAPLGTPELLAMVREKWHVYHLIVGEGSHARDHRDTVQAKWAALLGQRAVWLKDHRKMAQVIVSLMQVASGVDAKTVANSWDHDTKEVLRGMDLAGTFV